jgi:hypothetical protein
MELCATNRDEYSEQFESLLKSEPYKSVEGIVYFFKIKKPIARVRGECNIIYIGKSDGSFSSRYYPSKAFNLEMTFFDKFYKHVIELYGSISIEITQVEKPKYSEWKALSDYFSKHLEYPPLNRAIPNQPT